MANRNPNYKEDAKKGGRKPGVKNKLSRDMKQRIVDVWNTLECEEKGLLDEARNKPDWFYVNFVKPMLPKDIQIDASVTFLDKLNPAELETLEQVISEVCPDDKGGDKG